MVLDAAFRIRRSGRRRKADPSPPLSRRLPFQVVHRRGRHETARAGPAETGRCRRPVCSGASPRCRRGYDQPAIVPHTAGIFRDGDRQRLLGGPRAVRQRGEPAQGPGAAPGHRRQFAAQIFQSRLRAGWTGDPGRHRRALRRLGAAGDCGEGGPARNHAGCAAAGQGEAGARAREQDPAWPPPGLSRRSADPRAGLGDGVRQHRRRPRQILRPTGFNAPASVLSAASRREMSLPAMARPVRPGRAQLWAGNHQRDARWLGLVRPQRRLPGISDPHRGGSGPIPGDLGADQCGRWDVGSLA